MEGRREADAAQRPDGLRTPVRPLAKSVAVDDGQMAGASSFVAFHMASPGVLANEKRSRSPSMPTTGAASGLARMALGSEPKHAVVGLVFVAQPGEVVRLTGVHHRDGASAVSTVVSWAPPARSM